MNRRLRALARENVSSMSDFPVTPHEYTTEPFSLVHTNIPSILLYKDIYIGLKGTLEPNAKMHLQLQILL